MLSLQSCFCVLGQDFPTCKIIFSVSPAAASFSSDLKWRILLDSATEIVPEYSRNLVPKLFFYACCSTDAQDFTFSLLLFFAWVLCVVTGSRPCVTTLSRSAIASKLEMSLNSLFYLRLQTHSHINCESYICGYLQAKLNMWMQTSGCSDANQQWLWKELKY